MPDTRTQSDRRADADRDTDSDTAGKTRPAEDRHHAAAMRLSDYSKSPSNGDVRAPCRVHSDAYAYAYAYPDAKSHADTGNIFNAVKKKKAPVIGSLRFLLVVERCTSR